MSYLGWVNNLCGISGFYSFKEGHSIDRKTLKAMNDKIAHRGPDAEGYFLDKGIGISSRRLSIIDLKTGDQPIFNEDKSIVVVYNGEIYNFEKIKSDLEKKGHNFKTKSDTETIVHAYEEYGTDCVKHFNGMFAFAIWDKNKKKLVLARDRLGIKPLYYYHDKEKIVFSSEIKSIVEYPGLKRDLNEFALSDFLMFQNILDDKTFFKGIKKLLPGNILVIDKNGLSIKRYWDVIFTPKEKESEYLEERYRELLNQSVKDHLLSDVPLGSYLSGGFDSTSVATLASRSLHSKQSKLNTFTGYFMEGSKYSELNTAKDVAKKINAKMHFISMVPKDFKDNIKNIVYHLDEPTTGTGSFPQYMVSKMVSKHVKVVLTGHGGDELFCGYQVFKSIYYKELIRKNPLNIIRLVTGIKLSEFSKVMYYLFYPLLFDPSVKYGIFIMFNEKEQKKMLKKSFYEKISGYRPISTVESILKNKKMTDFEKTQYLYIKTYLPTLFILEDKVGMAHSIEARTPICGNDVVDFALSVPMKEKIKNNKLKSLIKRSMKDILPQSVYEQPKMGFPTPLAKWFKGPLKAFAYEILLGEKSKNRNIFNEKYIRKLLDTHSRSTTDTLYDYVRANKIFSLITIELWFQIYIDK
jgi:asparagine synthase (glutamine-hydrolysing)